MKLAIVDDEGKVYPFGSEKEARHAAAVCLLQHRKYQREEIAPIPPFKIGDDIRRSRYKFAMIWDLEFGKQYGPFYTEVDIDKKS